MFCNYKHDLVPHIRHMNGVKYLQMFPSIDQLLQNIYGVLTNVIVYNSLEFHT